MADAAPRGSQFAPFRHRAFALIWAAAIVSNLGSQLQQVGAAWVMTGLTGSAGRGEVVVIVFSK